MRIKIQNLLTDTVAQWVKHRRDKPWAWVRILANVILFIFSVAFFISLLPGRSVGRSNFDWGLQKFNNVDPNNDRQILKITMLKIDSTEDIDYKILYIMLYICIICIYITYVVMLFIHTHTHTHMYIYMYIYISGNVLCIIMSYVHILYVYILHIW